MRRAVLLLCLCGGCAAEPEPKLLHLPKMDVQIAYWDLEEAEKLIQKQGYLTAEQRLRAERAAAIARIEIAICELEAKQNKK